MYDSSEITPIMTASGWIVSGLIVTAVWAAWCAAGSFGVLALVAAFEIGLPLLLNRLPDVHAIVADLDAEATAH